MVLFPRLLCAFVGGKDLQEKQGRQQDLGLTTVERTKKLKTTRRSCQATASEPLLTDGTEKSWDQDGVEFLRHLSASRHRLQREQSVVQL